VTPPSAETIAKAVGLAVKIATGDVTAIPLLVELGLDIASPELLRNYLDTAAIARAEAKADAIEASRFGTKPG
jgi:hypothetical protein